MYSEDTDNVSYLINTEEDVEGLAYDPRTDVFYYSTSSVAIYRIGKDGTGKQEVLPLGRIRCESRDPLAPILFSPHNLNVFLIRSAEIRLGDCS